MADCDLISGGARIDAMRQRAQREAIPLHGTLALTHRCNFRCIHCYIQPGLRLSERELSTAEWLDLVKEAADAGCFSILLTGGEPMLRADFVDIYLGIRRLGIHVMLFTNASLVNERIVEALRAAPPRLIEISVYGASAETYQAITGNAQMFAAVQRGIGQLRAAGLPVRLKTVLMQANQHEFMAIRAMGYQTELPVRYDAVLQPRFRGDERMAALRVPPDEVAVLERQAIPDISEQWEKERRRRAAIRAATPQEAAPRLYNCAAGAISFYVTATGQVQPCVSATRYAVDWRPGGLLAAYRQSRDALRAVPMPPDYVCATCADKVFCGSCPPVAELDSGQETGICAYACQLAHERGRLAAQAQFNSSTLPNK